MHDCEKSIAMPQPACLSQINGSSSIDDDSGATQRIANRPSMTSVLQERVPPCLAQNILTRG
jgi:hypothetical protein